MPGPYDDNLKKLVDANPQDFVALVLGGGHLEKVLVHDLQSVHIFADSLLKVVGDEENSGPFLVHIEFQSGNDPLMQERLLEYNILASRQYNYLPVCSCVIYLKDGGTIAESPFIRKLPTGEEVVRFHYKSIELWRWSAEELIQRGLMGLLPLVPLTQGGTKHEIVQEVFTELLSAGKKDLLVVAHAIASLAFESKSEAEQEWFERIIAMQKDILRETRFYQGILKEGREEGLEKGREEGRQEALRQELQRQRQAVLDIVIERFPKIVRSVRKQVEAIEDPAILWHLIVKMSTLQSAEEAKQLILTVCGEEEQE